MKYMLTNVRIEKVAAGKTNANSLFIRADIYNPADLYDEGKNNVPIFQERLVNDFRQYFSIANNGTAQADSDIPTEKLVFDNGRLEEFVFPEEMVQVYNQDTDVNGVIHKAGTPVLNKFGDLRRYTGIIVLTKLTVDTNTGEMSYAHGWDKDSRGLRAMNAFYRPLSQFADFKAEGISPAQLINSASEPQTAAQPAQPVQQPQPVQPTGAVAAAAAI